MQRFLVLGGTGFIGRHFCEKASELECRLTVLTRRSDSAKAVQTLPWVDVIVGDAHDEATLNRLVAGHDAVVNLVAILHGSEAAFHRVHVALVEKLVRACQTSGVRRVLHVSALGAAPDAPSMYQRSKAQGEAVLTASGLDVALLRPSVVFGAGDQFLNLFAKLQAVFPVMPLAGAKTRFQPVWVEDVAQAMVELLQRLVRGTLTVGAGRVFEACGPDVFTLADLVRLAGRYAGHPRPILPLPAALARLQALLMEFAPGKTLMSRDNLDSMRVDNVATGKVAGLLALGISASALETIAPSYLQAVDSDPMLKRRRSAGRF
ncbi:MAG: complex I NDUFA9 subunit family protein [Rhodoferax sp.]|nr:complex I NDUFA9 subunit family protein [Rhodoferax sp.]